MIEKYQNISQYKFRTEILQSAAITLLLVLIYMLLIKIPIPFLTEGAIKEYLTSDGYVDSNSMARFSILPLGIMPYVSAYILIEILSLFVPYLKKFRKGDLNGRRKLKFLALLLTIFLGVIQGHGIIKGLRGMTLPNGAPVLNITNNFDFFLLVAILIAGVYFLIILCELISKYGVGNGISLILLAGICSRFFDSFNQMIPIYNEIGPGFYFLSFCLIFVLVFSTVFLLTSKKLVGIRHRLKNQPMNIFHFNFCPSAMVAKTYAASIIMIPTTISAFWDIDHNLVNMFAPGSTSYNITSFILIFIFSYLFAWIFFHPRQRLKKYRKMGWDFDTDELKIEHDLTKRLLMYNLPWTLFLCLMAIMPYILISSFNVPFYIGGASIPLVVAIILDILDKFSFDISAQEKHIKIAQFNDVYDAKMIKNFLSTEGVLCHLQGYYHRHLLYFFGPYIDIGLFVEESKKEFAIELLNKYFGGLGTLATNENRITH